MDGGGLTSRSERRSQNLGRKMSSRVGGTTNLQRGTDVRRIDLDLKY